MSKHSFVYYFGFRPTSHYHGIAWLGSRNIAIIGVEIAPDAVGFVIWGLWIGFVKEG
jgi:hypothetical protein